MPITGRFPRLVLLPLLAICLAMAAGCGAPASPQVTADGGDLVIHHQLELFKLLTGTRIMFRDEAVLRFSRDLATGELVYSHDPQTQSGSERLHPFMQLPMRPMPELQVTPTDRPAELPQADQAFRVQLGSHWRHEFMGRVDATTTWLVGIDSATRRILFQEVACETTELSDTAYNWRNSVKVLPIDSVTGQADSVPAAVGEFAQESIDRVHALQAKVPELGEAWRSALIDLADE